MKFHDFPAGTDSHARLAFEKSYTLDDCKRIKKGMKQFFTGYLSEANADRSVIRKIRQAYSSSFVPAKKNYSDLLALVFNSEENFMMYFAQLAEPVRQAWYDVLERNGISSRELIVRYKIPLPATGATTGKIAEAGNELCLFSSVTFYPSTFHFVEKNAAYYFYLPAPLRPLVITYCFPREQYNLTPLDTLPGDTGLSIYENRQQVLTDIPLIKGVEQQGYIVLNAKGNVNQTTVTTVERKITLSEFFDSVIKEVSCLRGYLLLTLYTRYEFSESQTDAPERYIRNLFQRQLPADFGWLLPLLMHHTKGYRELNKLENPGGEPFAKIVECICSAPQGKWISVKNLLLHSSYRGENLSPLPDAYLNKDYLKFRNESILKDENYVLITVPFVKSILFLLGAFGLVDLAYRDYSVSFDCYYEPLEYFRLTGFGEYALGKKNTFTRLSAPTEKHYFEADDNNLIIRSLEPDNVYEKLLAEMAIPICKNRFKVNSISFLRSCKTAADIENKINFFHLFICPQPSKIWTDFFESVKKRINPLAEVKSNFKLFKLNPENTELIRLVAQDPLIRKFVLKVENHHLLVMNCHIPKVVERLKAYGYLL